MKELLTMVTEHVVVTIDALALLVISYGTAEAMFSGVRVMLSSRSGTQGETPGCTTHAGWSWV